MKPKETARGSLSHPLAMPFRSENQPSFAFVAYLAILQAFVLYVRIQAKLANDRAVVTLTNPLSSVLQSQLLGGGTGDSANGGGGAGGAAKKVPPGQDGGHFVR